MDISLNKKRALVGGGSQGIGRAVAMEFAALGASVTLLARSETALEQTLAELPTTQGQQHTFVAADMAKVDFFRETVQAHVKQHGPYHILVNNSGGPPPGAIIDAATKDFQTAFSQHLIANHILTQMVWKGMRRENYGRIINVISTSVKQPIDGLGVSNTIRAAVANWAKTLAGELGPFGITVNNVLPGSTDTKRLQSLFADKAKRTNTTVEALVANTVSKIPLGRISEAAEVANAVAFLASPAASYITGVSLAVDGGRTTCH